MRREGNEIKGDKRKGADGKEEKLAMRKERKGERKRKWKDGIFCLMREKQE